MADALGEVLTEFDLWQKTLATTTDNASNMKSMMGKLSLQYDGMAHVINLACKAAMKILDTNKGNEAANDDI